VKPVTVPFFISHQGCPHTCVFCDQRTISGAAGRLPTANEIVSKISLWRVTAGGRPLEVAFFGGTFTALSHEIQAGLLEPLQSLLNRGEISAVRLSTRPDYIDGRRVEWLKKLGVTTIELGIQSMDDAVLETSDRGHSAAESDAAIRCVKGHGVVVGAQLMPGLPGDSLIKSLSSLERVIAAGADFIRIYPTVVIQGTELARRFSAGEYYPLGLEQGINLCKLLLHRAMKSNLPVVRMGLQADDGLNSETVLAGCWHPSFGQIVSSRLYGDLIDRYVSDDELVTISCHPARLSDVIGHKRSNLARLLERRVQAQVVSDKTLKKEEITIQKGIRSFRYNLITDLNYSIHEVN